MESNFLPINPRVHVSATQLAWLPFDVTETEHDFVQGLCTIAGSGDPTLREGLATHVFTANKSMENSAFVNSDGDFLIVAQQGALDIQTEFGKLYVQPGEICVIQRGQRFKVGVEGPTRGYILEVWGANFELPELGPLGANGLANARDFLSPVAHYTITKDDPWKVVYKLGGKFFESKQNHCPFDVVAWHGNYVSFFFGGFPLVFTAENVSLTFPSKNYTGTIQVRLDQIRQCRKHQRRPHRPVHLLRLDGPLARPSSSLGRLSHLQPALGRGIKHLPPTVLPPQRRL
jgi:homogentisate 1,2-dioxygenase